MDPLITQQRTTPHAPHDSSSPDTARCAARRVGCVDDDAPEDELRCQALFRAIILQAVQDAVSARKRKYTQQIRREALHWLLGDSPSFVEVCDFADFQPEYVRTRAKLVIAGRDDTLARLRGVATVADERQPRFL